MLAATGGALAKREANAEPEPFFGDPLFFVLYLGSTMILFARGCRLRFSPLALCVCLRYAVFRCIDGVLLNTDCMRAISCIEQRAALVYSAWCGWLRPDSAENFSFKKAKACRTAADFFGWRELLPTTFLLRWQMIENCAAES